MLFGLLVAWQTTQAGDTPLTMLLAITRTAMVTLGMAAGSTAVGCTTERQQGTATAWSTELESRRAGIREATQVTVVLALALTLTQGQVITTQGRVTMTMGRHQAQPTTQGMRPLARAQTMQQGTREGWQARGTQRTGAQGMQEERALTRPTPLGWRQGRGLTPHPHLSRRQVSMQQRTPTLAPMALALSLALALALALTQAPVPAPPIHHPSKASSSPLRPRPIPALTSRQHRRRRRTAALMPLNLRRASVPSLPSNLPLRLCGPQPHQ